MPTWKLSSLRTSAARTSSGCSKYLSNMSRKSFCVARTPSGNGVTMSLSGVDLGHTYIARLRCPRVAQNEQAIRVKGARCPFALA